jgi:glycosyltransferase involved in cell wall biosynthesis
MPAPLVTAIVSTYNAERFIKGCLDDLLAQTIASDLEILVIDSGSPQDERSVCAPYAERFPAVRYIRTERESLYAAWNRGISLSRGKYITSANADDRHRADGLERLVVPLERDSNCMLAYANQFVSEVPNETHEQCAARGARVLRYPDFSPQALMISCLGGPQPVWRRDAHSRAGMFDTQFKVSGDWDFWMRLAQYGPFRHMDEVLGVFYMASDTISGSANHLTRDTENLLIKQRFLQQPPWNSIHGLPQAVAADTFGTGYRYVSRKDLRNAKPFLRESLRLDPFNVRFAKTYFLRCVLGLTVGLNR